MATLEQLCSDGKLEKVTGLLGNGNMPYRDIYLLPVAAKWMRETLPSLETDGFVDGAVKPNEQAFVMFKAFVSGDDMFATEMYPKPLMPADENHGIWELRTPDLRFFGWFVRKGCFLVASVETKQRLLEHGLVPGHRNQATQMRSALELDEPKFLDGRTKDVF